MDHEEFFQVLGYLTNPIRRCKLDAEMHELSCNRFERRYEDNAGELPDSSNPHYIILHQEADKWGIELRIYFDANEEPHRAIKDLLREPSPGSDRRWRINNNDLIWDLIYYGFRLAESQNEQLVRGLVENEEPQNIELFNSGYAMPF